MNTIKLYIVEYECKVLEDGTFELFDTFKESLAYAKSLDERYDSVIIYFADIDPEDVFIEDDGHLNYNDTTTLIQGKELIKTIRS